MRARSSARCCFGLEQTGNRLSVVEDVLRPAIIGTSFSITVTAYDAYGNVATGYRGTVHFSSTDSKASLPTNYTFTSGDSGIHTFNNVKLKTKGNQTITAVDTLFSSITGSLTVNVM
jgi:hypothetical protein